MIEGRFLVGVSWVKGTWLSGKVGKHFQMYDLKTQIKLRRSYFEILFDKHTDALVVVVCLRLLLEMLWKENKAISCDPSRPRTARVTSNAHMPCRLEVYQGEPFVLNTTPASKRVKDQPCRLLKCNNGCGPMVSPLPFNHTMLLPHHLLFPFYLLITCFFFQHRLPFTLIFSSSFFLHIHCKAQAEDESSKTEARCSQ